MRKIIHDNQVILGLYNSGLDQNQIAKKVGASPSCVSQHLRNLKGYIPRGGKNLWRDRKKINRVIELYATGMPLAEVGRQVSSKGPTIKKILIREGVMVRNQSEAQTGKWNPCWRGGVRLLGNYRYIYQPNHPARTKQDCVAEHRLVMEKKIGRFLLRDEVVHHKDGDTLNNKPRNLQLFRNNAEHLAHDLKGRVPKWSASGKARILASVRSRSNKV